MVRSTDITSFTAHRQNLRDHLRQVGKTGRPLFITTNGQTDAVVLSPEAYDELAERAELAQSLALIDRGMQDPIVGTPTLDSSTLEKIAEELGLQIDR